MSDVAAAEMRADMRSNIENVVSALSDAESWIGLGQSQKIAGDYEAAINSYNRALQLDKDQLLALISLGLLYLHKSDVAGAISLLRRATIVDDAAHQAWDALGLAEMANGAADRACAAHRTACALEPTHIGYALHYIDACVASGQSDDLMTA
ncbi:MAG TPA: tetratricopeptide repeat protein, partial [Acetobacteraceae bacterium]|nr:tetratricopeptide repeat protein [Acetobacteraceae bacterium]